MPYTETVQAPAGFAPEALDFKDKFLRSVGHLGKVIALQRAEEAGKSAVSKADMSAGLLQALRELNEERPESAEQALCALRRLLAAHGAQQH